MIEFFTVLGKGLTIQVFFVTINDSQLKIELPLCHIDIFMQPTKNIHIAPN